MPHIWLLSIFCYFKQRFTEWFCIHISFYPGCLQDYSLKRNRSKVTLIRLGFATIANNSQISVVKLNKSIPTHTTCPRKLAGGLLHTVSRRPRLPHVAVCPFAGVRTSVFLPAYLLGVLFKSWTKNYAIDKVWNLVIIL